jgi:hypothetical protein
MIAKFIETLFGCRHKNYSFPITIKPGRQRNHATHPRTYVVCLDCSRELVYDWARMRVTAEPPASISTIRGTTAESVAA